jgi:hypothetical protein
MEIGTTIVTFALAVVTDGPAVAAAVAVMVTPPGPNPIPAAGAVGGAVKVAGTPLAVCEGEIEPQGRLEQSTNQSTPELVVSFETVAVTVAVALTSIVLGGTWVRLMVIWSVTVKVAWALKLWSAVANAVIVTVPPTMPGICSGPGTMKDLGPPDAE